MVGMDLFPHVAALERLLGFEFRERRLLMLAFVHRSFWNEFPEKLPGYNERLEFLGDSVLNLIVGEYLYMRHPERSEGELSDLRAHLVEASSCMRYADKLDLGQFLLLGRGEKTNLGKGRKTILADLFEALMGAIYLDQGYGQARNFFLSTFEKEIEAIIAAPPINAKALLQDLIQKRFHAPPIYTVLEEEGPIHARTFRVAVFANEKKLGEGRGSSKKEAQQEAAASALMHLGQPS